MHKCYHLLLLAVLFSSCGNNNTKDNTKLVDTTVVENTITTGTELPFIGKKEFETRPGISGTGTPHRYVEINKDGEVFFSFEQENQADGTITKERYAAGKFNKYMKCVFKEWDNEVRYYTITKEKIFEVDENNKPLTNEDCCNNNNYELAGKCPCESALH